MREWWDENNISQSIAFQKNSDWKLVLVPNSWSDFLENQNIKPIVIGVVGMWHVWYAVAQILEVLDHKGIDWWVILLSPKENLQEEISKLNKPDQNLIIVSANTDDNIPYPDLSLSWFVDKLNHDLELKIISLRDEIQEILLTTSKPHHDINTKNFHQHSKPNIKAPYIKKQFIRKFWKR